MLKLIKKYFGIVNNYFAKFPIIFITLPKLPKISNFN